MILKKANIIDPSVNKRLVVTGITKTRLFALTQEERFCCVNHSCSTLTLSVPLEFTVNLNDLFDVDHTRVVAGSCDFFLFYYSSDNLSWTQLEPHSCTECITFSALNGCEFIDASFSINDSVSSVSYNYVVLTANATQIETDIVGVYTWDAPWLVVNCSLVDRYNGLRFSTLVSLTNSDALAHSVYLSLRADGSEVSRSTVLRNSSTLVRHCANNDASACLAGNLRFGTELCRFDCVDFEPLYLNLTLSPGSSTTVEAIIGGEIEFEELPIVLEVEV